MYSQNVVNIDLPTGGSTMPGDILYANNRIYVYSSDEISVYNENTEDLLGKVPLNNWGKFNPFYFNAPLWPGEYKAMAYNNDLSDLYVVTPNLHIMVIEGNLNPVDISPKIIVNQEETLEQFFFTLNGRVKIKYDENHDLLYLLISSRDPTSNDPELSNCTGQFHVGKNFFGIYKINNTLNPGDPSYIELFYSQIYDRNDYDYEDQMINFEFNEKQGQDYFYLARLGTFEIWELPDDLTQPFPTDIEPILTYPVPTGLYDGYYKFGKMLYIYDNPVHKIVLAPYRRPLGSSGHFEAKLFVIDGDHTNNPDNTNINVIDAPSKGILDIAYLEGSDDLICSYAPDEDVQISPPPGEDYSDIAIYSHDNGNFSYKTAFSTNQIPNTSIYDTNSSIQLLAVEPSEILVSKKDQIVKLSYNANNDTYTHTQLLEAENNIFMKGACGNNKSYIINSTMGKLEVYLNSDFSNHSEKKIGHPVYHIASNSTACNMYIYNKLNVENTGFYSYMEGTPPSTNYIGVDKPIGDVVHNPFNDHFLVSQIDDGAATIKVFDAGDNNILPDITIPDNAVFAKEMFISKEGKLYILTNMQFTETPQLFIYDAVTYQKLVGPLAIAGLTCNDEFIYYTAYFDQDTDDVYISIYPQEIRAAPYNTEANSMYDLTPAGIGKLLRISTVNDVISDVKTINFPGKVICPERNTLGNNSQYDGKVFVIGKSLYMYNSETGNGYPYTEPDFSDFIDVAYNAVCDKLFLFKNTPDPTCDENRSCVIWEVAMNGDIAGVVPYSIDPIPGQAAAFFSNPYDGRVYLHQKIDNVKLGDVQVSLHSFDPLDASPGWTTTPLGITSFAPEHDQTNDPGRSFFYNITTHYINPYTNHIYLPNGGHSCVSKVGFTPNEALLLNDGEWAWLSFPRMNRDGDDAVPVNTVLLNNIEPDGYLDESELENLPPESWMIEDNIYDGTQWQLTGDLINIQSSLGYKLQLLYAPPLPENKWVHLLGKVLDPAEDVNIYENYDNWVGYWLYESQSPFDAIPENVLDELTIIKAQTWCCVKDWDYPDGYAVPYWVCAVHEDDVSMDYGDMVILETNSDMSFQWQSTGNPSSIIDKDATEYYQFTEQADYTSFFIELDTTENPQEIGAFIEDSCVGASTVLAGDTIVLIPGYTEGISGDVVFEEYYGSQKSANPEIDEYLVRNKNTGSWKKRAINTREKQDYYFISFKSGKEKEENNNEQLFNIFPNPVNKALNINYNVERTALVNIGVYDSYGRHITALFSSTQPEGLYGIQWNLAGNNGKKLSKGFYIIKLKIDDIIISRKIVVN